MKFRIISFIGLGLITGSVARAIREKREDAVIKAYDPDPSAVAEAMADGVVDIAAADVSEAASDCDLVFLGAPVGANSENLAAASMAAGENTIFTDVGSVKSGIHMKAVELGLSGRFIGGHPMTGSERVGYRNSSAALLENAYYILAPEDDVPGDVSAAMTELVSDIGALPVVIRPDEHDMYTAGISHLPHVVSAALVNLIRDSDDSGVMKTIAAGGFKDITRISSSSPELWSQICVTNRRNIVSLLDRYIAGLEKAREMISESDGEGLIRFFGSARDYRSGFGDRPSGDIRPVFRLHADIADRPGALSDVVSLLAGSGINIKNIGITHNREYQQGALAMEFGSQRDMDRAAKLLSDRGYRLH